MNAILSILRSLRHKESIVEVRYILVFLICLILLITVDNLIADRVSKNWHPTLGIVFGVSTVICLGGLMGFPSLKKIRIMEATGTKRILWISGRALTILGCTVVLLYDSIVLINVLPLNIVTVFFIIGVIVLFIGCILSLVEDFVKHERIGKTCGKR